MNAAQLRRVNAESFAHYRQGLVELLLDAVKQGASVGFMANLRRRRGPCLFRRRTAELDKGRLLWVVVQEEQGAGQCAVVAVPESQRPESR